MKLIIRYSLYAFFGIALAGAPTVALAEETPPAQQAPGDNGQKTRMLDQLLKLNDQELAELRKTVERIERMTPEERQGMRERIQNLQEENPERIQEIRKQFEEIPEEKRQEMRQRWMEMTPEERRDWRKQFRDMSPEERREAFQREGFLPAPARNSPDNPKPRQESPENTTESTGD